MVKINKILTTGMVGAILAVGFTGCGNPPQPYKYQMPKKYSTISDYEKQQLLNIIIDRESRLKYKSHNGCILYTNNWYKEGFGFKYRENMKNCFIIEDDIIFRIDKSSCSNDHGRSYGKCSYISSNLENYTNFLNKLQDENILANGLNKEITNYTKFINFYKKAQQSRDKKLELVKASVKDATNVLQQKAIDTFEKSIKTISLRTQRPLDLYKSYIAPKKGKSAIDRFGRSILGDSISQNFDRVFKDEASLAYDFKIKSYIAKSQVERYKVQYDKNKYIDSYNKFPSRITYKINKVYFSYIPKKFMSNDKNIDVEIINEPLNYGSIKYIKIYNKTKEFIEIDTIAGYYGDIVTDNIINIKDMKRVKISPMSYKMFKTGYSYEYRINDFPEKKFLLVNDKNQKVNYGFSIGYKMINQNIIRNLYKVDNYSIKDFK